MLTTLRKLAKNIYKFYRYDCCWPYALSFYLALVIFYLEAVVIKNPSKWASILSYTILLAYYLWNRKLFDRSTLNQKRNLSFFMSFLTTKIVMWGCIVAWVVLL